MENNRPFEIGSDLPMHFEVVLVKFPTCMKSSSSVENSEASCQRNLSEIQSKQHPRASFRILERTPRMNKLDYYQNPL